MATIKFGTDGWRAVIADEFTFSNVRIVAQALADYWKQQHDGTGGSTGNRAVIGYDHRFLSEKFAEATAEVLSANGITCWLSDGAATTPGVSFAVKKHGLVGGVMITASHNPPQFNGFKVKGAYAGPADPEETSQVEKLIGATEPKRLLLRDAMGQGRVVLRGLRAEHAKAIRDYVDWPRLKRARLRAVHDSMHGTGKTFFSELLKGSNTRVVTIRATRDPLFGGLPPEPIEQNLGALQQYLRKHPADIGLATDGDADRLGATDGHGNYLTPHQILALLLLHLARNRKQRGAVVKSINMSAWCKRIADALGLECIETPVGFKHTCKLMRAKDVLIGVEESGGYGVRGHIPERDGFLAGMLLLEMLAVEKKGIPRLLAQLDKEFGKLRFGRVDMHIEPGDRNAFFTALKAASPTTLGKSTVDKIQTEDGIKWLAGDAPWLLVRASGTEPVVRVYAEAEGERGVAELLKAGEKLVKNAIKK